MHPSNNVVKQFATKPEQHKCFTIQMIKTCCYLYIMPISLTYDAPRNNREKWSLINNL